MCYPVRCSACGKTTWDGCGQHVDDVMRSVPAGQWCTCSEDTTPPPGQTRELRSLFRR